MTDQIDHGSVVQKFACALVAGDFVVAHSLLDPELSARTSPASLQAQLREMIDHGEGPPEYALQMTEFGDWPDRRSTDIGWAYSSIVGPGYSEAVTGVVTEEGLIRRLEWGKAAARRRLTRGCS